MTNAKQDFGGLKEQMMANPEFSRIQEAIKSDSERAIEAAQQLGTQARMELTQVALLILEVDSRARAEKQEDELRLKDLGRRRLAASLGCTNQDLQDIVDSYGDQWQEFILEERIKMGMNSTHMRDVTWDSLEAAVLQKLAAVVNGAGIKLTVAEMLAIANSANKAVRGDRKPATLQGQHTQIGNQTNVFLPGSPADGVLPAGNLGKITLSLTPRVFKQIEGQATREQTDSRMLDSIEMLGIKDIQTIGSESNNGDEK